MSNILQDSPTRINGIDWFLAVTRNMSFWHQELSNEGHHTHTKDFGVNTNLETLIVTVNGTQTHAFYRQPNYAEYSKAVLEAISTKEKIRTLKKRYEVIAQELLEALDECNRNLTVTTWENFTEKYCRMCAGLMITATVGRSGGDLLMEKLKAKKFKESEIPRIVGVITYPAQHTPLLRSQLDLLEIGIKIQDHTLSEGETEKELGAWLKKYGNIPANLSDDPWTEKDVRDQLETILKKDCKKEFLALEESHVKKVKESEELIKKIDDQEIEVLAYGIAEGTYLNEFRKNVFSAVSVGYRPFFQKIAHMFGSNNWRDCFYLTSSEIKDILQGKKVPVEDIIKKRQKVGMYRTKDVKNEFLDEGTVNGLIEYVHSLHGAGVPSQDSVIRGHSANGGKVKGIVKIILGSQDFHKLNVGEILVTTMTSVDFVPIMGKAAAFVTNEGGITSHASIVSREMNKPCIIGTKIATQVLKDGDLVEVNADEGTVKKI